MQGQIAVDGANDAGQRLGYVHDRREIAAVDARDVAGRLTGVPVRVGAYNGYD